MCVCEGGGDAGGRRARPRPRTPDAHHSPCVGPTVGHRLCHVPLVRVPEPLAERQFDASEWGGARMTPCGTGARQPLTVRHASKPRPARWWEARVHTARLPRCASVVSHPASHGMAVHPVYPGYAGWHGRASRPAASQRHHQRHHSGITTTSPAASQRHHSGITAASSAGTIGGRPAGGGAGRGVP